MSGEFRVPGCESVVWLREEASRKYLVQYRVHFTPLAKKRTQARNAVVHLPIDCLC